MLVKHLLSGTMVGVFALALGVDPAAVEQGAAGSDPAAGKAVRTANDDKKPERIAKETVTASNRDRDGQRAKDQDSWARRLVFPSGNKF